MAPEHVRHRMRQAREQVMHDIGMSGTRAPVTRGTFNMKAFGSCNLLDSEFETLSSETICSEIKNGQPNMVVYQCL